MKLITQAEYARSRTARGLPGGTKPGVKKAVDTGRLMLIDGKLDPVAADRQWDENTSQKQQRSSWRQVDRAEPEKSERTGETKNDAETRKEIALANLREREDREKAGELLPAADVERTWGGILRRIKSTLLILPDEIAPRVAAESDVRKCRAIIDREIRDALTSLGEPEDDEANAA